MIKTSVKGSLSDYLSGDIAGKDFTFRLVKQNVNPSMLNTNGQPIVFVGSFRLEAYSVINDRDPKDPRIVKQRTIRYIQGEPSIYKDQQSDDRDVPKKKYFIEFTNGRKIVNGTNDAALLDFMMKCNQNKSNENRKTATQPLFELVDNTANVKNAMQKDKARAEAEHFCYYGEWDQVAPFARVLNVNMNQSADEVRYDLKLIATRDPEKFLRDMKRPELRRKHYVLEAIDMGFLSVNKQTNSICWSSNPESPLDVAPAGKDVIDTFCIKLGQDDFAPVYEAIVDAVKPAPMVVTKPFVPEKASFEGMKSQTIVNPAANGIVEESTAELADIIEKCIEKGIIATKPPVWLVYDGVNYKKVEGMVEKIKNDLEIVKNLKYELHKAELSK